MKSEIELRKAYNEINKRHSRIFRVHNSPLAIPGEAEWKDIARAKWLERTAGLIMCLEWVLNDDKELPDFIHENFG